MLRSVRICFIAALLAPIPTIAQQTLGDSYGTHDYPITRGDNAQIGLPFDTVTSQFKGPEPCIEGFTSFTSEGDKGPYDKRLMQVSNTLGLMRTLNIDVSASGKVFGGEVTGKMGFAHDSKLNQTSLNYALYAHYQGAPEKIKVKEGASIRLTKPARNILKNKGEAAFREKCGDSFVSMIYTGAQGYAILSFHSVDQSTRNSISSSMQAKGAGWSVDSKVNATVNQQKASGKLQITYSQTGGKPVSGVSESGTPVDAEWASVKTAIDGLNQTPNTVNVGYQVQSYDALVSWNHNKLTPSPDLLRLAYYRAAYNTMLNTVEPLVNKPGAAEFTHVLGRNQNAGAGDQDSLSKLQNDLLANRATVEQLYKDCNDWRVKNAPAKCADDHALTASLDDEATDPYLLMARLPLQMANPAQPAEAFLGKPDLVDAIFDQDHVTARNSYCQFEQNLGFKHPGCMDIPQLRAAYKHKVEDAVSDIWYPAPGLYQMKSLYRHDATCLTAQTAKSSDQKLYMKTCASDAPKALQRFRWLPTGQLQIREKACIAAPVKNGAHLSPHACHSKEGVQQWRFIPVKRDANARKPGAAGVLQEAGYGRCLLFGTPKQGEKTYVVTNHCNLDSGNQHWSYIPK